MFKLTAIVSLVLIGSTLWAATLPCDSCGSECAAACGTRHFRSCCFNYLRRKRDPDVVKMFPQKLQDPKQDYRQNQPLLLVFDDPEPWKTMANDIKPYPYEDMVENRMIMNEI